MIRNKVESAKAYLALERESCLILQYFEFDESVDLFDRYLQVSFQFRESFEGLSEC